MSSRRLMIPAVSTLFFFSALLFSLPSGKDGRMEVTLVDNDGNPLSGASIILQGPIQIRPMPMAGSIASSVQMPSETTAITDSAGRTRFERLAPGQYSIRAQKNGYVGVASSAAYYIPAFASISAFVQEGQPPQQIELTLLRGVTISGKITDSAGNAVAGARVYACILTVQNGRRALQSNASAQTDDHGDYRLFWFGPGDYYIVGEPLPRGVNTSSELGKTFYPGVPGFAEAKPVSIKDRDITGIDFRLQSIKTFRVRGRVLDLPSTGNYRMMPSFNFVSRDSNVVQTPFSVSAPVRTNPDTGEFEILGIPQGSWNIFATLMMSNVSSGPAQPGMSRYLSGRVAVDILDKDINDVRIVMYSLDVKGKVIIPKPVSVGNLIQNIRVSLQPKEATPPFIFGLLQSSQPLTPDGDFEFHGVAPGRYGVSISAPVSIADVRVGSKSIMNDGIIEIGTESPDSIKIIMADKMLGISGMVQGITRDTTVEQLSTTRVILVPDPPRRQNSLLYKSVELSNVRGNFYFNSVSPGSYRIFAIEGLRPGDELDPSFMARYENRGTAINVSMDQSINSLQVRWIRK